MHLVVTVTGTFSHSASLLWIVNLGRGGLQLFKVVGVQDLKPENVQQANERAQVFALLCSLWRSAAVDVGHQPREQAVVQQLDERARSLLSLLGDKSNSNSNSTHTA